MSKLPAVSVFPLYLGSPCQVDVTEVKIGPEPKVFRVYPAGHRISYTDPRWRGGCTVGYRAAATWDVWLIEDTAGTVLGLLFQHDSVDGVEQWTVQLRRVTHALTDLRAAADGFGGEHAFDSSASFAASWTTAIAQKIALLSMARESLTLDPRIGETREGRLTVDGAPLEHAGHHAVFDRNQHRFVFTGAPTGEHSIDAGRLITSADRVLAHWHGYLQPEQS